jgi:phosphohistidine phosphatase SixA
MKSPNDGTAGPHRTIFLVRHAEPVSYAVWQGDDPSRPLSDLGRRQASDAGRYLKRFEIYELRCATHERCRETAALIGVELGLEPILDDRLHIARRFDLPDVAGRVVWVAHSNNIPGALARAGVSGHACGHASVWSVEVDLDGRVVRADYYEPAV